MGSYRCIATELQSFSFSHREIILSGSVTCAGHKPHDDCLSLCYPIILNRITAKLQQSHLESITQDFLQKNKSWMWPVHRTDKPAKNKTCFIHIMVITLFCYLNIHTDWWVSDIWTQKYTPFKFISTQNILLLEATTSFINNFFRLGKYELIMVLFIPAFRELISTFSLYVQNL